MQEVLFQQRAASTESRGPNGPVLGLMLCGYGCPYVSQRVYFCRFGGLLIEVFMLLRDFALLPCRRLSSSSYRIQPCLPSEPPPHTCKAILSVAPHPRYSHDSRCVATFKAKACATKSLFRTQKAVCPNDGRGYDSDPLHAKTASPQHGNLKMGPSLAFPENLGHSFAMTCAEIRKNAQAACV